MDWLSVDHIQAIVGQTMSTQIAQFGIAFTIAAWLHSGRVKKEISFQFGALTTAVTALGDALRADLKKQTERIDIVEDRLGTLEHNKEE